MEVSCQNVMELGTYNLFLLSLKSIYLLVWMEQDFDNCMWR